MGRQVFTAGEILTAANMNDLGDQTVMVFDDATDRATAIPTPVEGMTTYLKDTDLVEVFDGSDFVPVAIEPDPPAILQVVSTVKSDIFTTTSASFTDITGLSVTITPSSTSSKILVLATIQGSHVGDTAEQNTHLEQRRDSTTIHVGDASASSTRTSGSVTSRTGSDRIVHTSSWAVLDEPNTTSAVTYSVRIRSTSGTALINRGRNTGTANDAVGISSITVMEVAG